MTGRICCECNGSDDLLGTFAVRLGHVCRSRSPHRLNAQRGFSFLTERSWNSTHPLNECRRRESKAGSPNVAANPTPLVLATWTRGELECVDFSHCPQGSSRVCEVTARLIRLSRLSSSGRKFGPSG